MAKEPKRVHCADCKHWEPGNDGGERRIGICHLLPPIGSKPSQPNASFWCNEGEKA